MKLMRFKEVSAVTGLPRSSLYQAIKRGTFPKPIALGARSVAWTSEDIDQWLREKIAASAGISAAVTPPP